VFDGHNGSRVADFAAQRMPAELLLGQLQNKRTDEEIKEVLRQVSKLIRRYRKQANKQTKTSCKMKTNLWCREDDLPQIC
jgi:serine/threonine protein phosphatase PrpC